MMNKMFGRLSSLSGVESVVDSVIQPAVNVASAANIAGTRTYLPAMSRKGASMGPILHWHDHFDQI
jgi:hypothetical protein